MEKTIEQNKRIPLVSLALREKKFLINDVFQIKFMISLICVSLFSMGIMYLANQYFFEIYMAKGKALNLPPDHPFYLMILEQKKFMFNVFLISSVISTAILAFWGLFYSHKIAGPLYRLHHYFIDAGIKGKVLNKKIYFRDNDFFQEIPNSINKYIESMRMEENNQHNKKSNAS
jgi:hypothetical protein